MPKIQWQDPTTKRLLEADWLSPDPPTDADLDEMTASLDLEPVRPGIDYDPSGSSEPFLHRVLEQFEPTKTPMAPQVGGIRPGEAAKNLGGMTAADLMSAPKRLLDMLVGTAMDKVPSQYYPQGYQPGENEAGQLIGTAIQSVLSSNTARGAPIGDAMLPPPPAVPQDREAGFIKSLTQGAGGMLSDPTLIATVPSVAARGYFLPQMTLAAGEAWKQREAAMKAGDAGAQGMAEGDFAINALMGGLIGAHGLDQLKEKTPGKPPSDTGEAPPPDTPADPNAMSPLTPEMQASAAAAAESRYRGYVHERLRAAFSNVAKPQMDVALYLLDKFAAKVREATGVDMYSKMDAQFVEGDSKGGHSKAITDIPGDFVNKGVALINAFQRGDFSSVVHEMTHVARPLLGVADLAIFEKWLGIEGGKWETHHEEAFARAFEYYLKSGIAPNDALKGVFEKIKGWMVDIYSQYKEGLEGAPVSADDPRPALAKLPTSEVTAWFDSVIGSEGRPGIAPDAFRAEGVRRVADLQARIAAGRGVTPEEAADLQGLTAAIEAEDLAPPQKHLMQAMGPRIEGARRKGGWAEAIIDKVRYDFGTAFSKRETAFLREFAEKGWTRALYEKKPPMTKQLATALDEIGRAKPELWGKQREETPSVLTPLGRQMLNEYERTGKLPERVPDNLFETGSLLRDEMVPLTERKTPGPASEGALSSDTAPRLSKLPSAEKLKMQPPPVEVTEGRRPLPSASQQQSLMEFLGQKADDKTLKGLIERGQKGDERSIDILQQILRQGGFDDKAQAVEAWRKKSLRQEEGERRRKMPTLGDVARMGHRELFSVATDPEIHQRTADPLVHYEPSVIQEFISEMPTEDLRKYVSHLIRKIGAGSRGFQIIKDSGIDYDEPGQPRIPIHDVFQEPVPSAQGAEFMKHELATYGKRSSYAMKRAPGVGNFRTEQEAELAGNHAFGHRIADVEIDTSKKPRRLHQDQGEKRHTQIGDMEERRKLREEAERVYQNEYTRLRELEEVYRHSGRDDKADEVAAAREEAFDRYQDLLARARKGTISLSQEEGERKKPSEKIVSMEEWKAEKQLQTRTWRRATQEDIANATSEEKAWMAKHQGEEFWVSPRGSGLKGLHWVFGTAQDVAGGLAEVDALERRLSGKLSGDETQKPVKPSLPGEKAKVLDFDDKVTAAENVAQAERVKKKLMGIPLTPEEVEAGKVFDAKVKRIIKRDKRYTAALDRDEKAAEVPKGPDLAITLGKALRESEERLSDAELDAFERDTKVIQRIIADQALLEKAGWRMPSAKEARELGLSVEYQEGLWIREGPEGIDFAFGVEGIKSLLKEVRGGDGGGDNGPPPTKSLAQTQIFKKTSKAANTAMELTRAAAVGDIATSIGNFISGAAHGALSMGGGPIAAFLANRRATKWEKQGRHREAAEERAAAKRFTYVSKHLPKATWDSVGEGLVDTLTVLHLGKGTQRLQDQITLLKRVGLKEPAEKLEHFSNVHIGSADKFETVKKGLMIANIFGDRVFNGAYLTAHIDAFAQEVGARDNAALLAMLNKDRDLRQRFGWYMQETVGEAFKATWQLPFANEAMKWVGHELSENPVMNAASLLLSPFYKALGANLIMNTTEIFPTPAVQKGHVVPSFGEFHMSKRVRNSFQHDAMRQQLRVLQDKLASTPQAQTKARTSLRNQIHRKMKDMRQLEESRIYNIHTAKARAMQGPILMAMAALWRLSRGDDGTEFDQIPDKKDEKGKATMAWYINRALGELIFPLYWGDYLGHWMLSQKTGKPFKYGTADGTTKVASYIQESFSGSRYGIPDPALDLIKQILGEDKKGTSTEYLKRLGTEALANVGRMAGTLGIVGGAARLAAEASSKEEHLGRRTDAKGPLDAVKKGFQSRIPNVGQGKEYSRLALPTAPDWKNLDHSKSVDPVQGTLTGMTKGRISPITRFVNAHQGKMSMSDILPKRTGDPTYDEIHLQAWIKRATPLMVVFDKIESWPEQAQIDEVKSLFKAARARAAEDAIKTYKKQTGQSPEAVVKKAQREEAAKASRKQRRGLGDRDLRKLLRRPSSPPSSPRP